MIQGGGAKWKDPCPVRPSQRIGDPVNSNRVVHLERHLLLWTARSTAGPAGLLSAMTERLFLGGGSHMARVQRPRPRERTGAPRPVAQSSS